MSALALSDTAPELAVRRALFRFGLRYRVQLRAPGNHRLRIDLAFTRAKIAVIMDGCD